LMIVPKIAYRFILLSYRKSIRFKKIAIL